MKANHHIEIRQTRSGESKAYIASTRVGVDNIYVCHDLQGMTPDEIVRAYPHVSLAQVHAALAYFYDHASEIREQMKRNEEFADRMEDAQVPSGFSRLRDELVRDKEVHGDSVSS